MQEPELNSQIELTESAIEEAKRRFGDNHLEVAQCLETCAKLLKASKQRLLEAANMEAKAQLIRRHNFEKNVAARESSQTDSAGRAEVPADQPAVGKTRTCPYCGASIEREAILCRFCNAGDMQSAKVISEIFLDEPDKRICPFCGGKLARDAMVCWFCNAKLPPLSSGVAHHAASPNKKHMKPMQAALLSGLTLNGAAQIRMGQGKKGSAMILGSLVLGTLTMGFSVLITAPIAAYDAYMIASKLQKGKSVDTWEFF